jgi:AmiR/NasT family two-component response regulator
MPHASIGSAIPLRVPVADDSAWLPQVVRVVLWTGEDDAQLASAIRRSGAHAGVPKGVATVELIATLQGPALPRPGSVSW